jgi:hypothetical protein
MLRFVAYLALFLATGCSSSTTGHSVGQASSSSDATATSSTVASMRPTSASAYEDHSSTVSSAPGHDAGAQSDATFDGASHGTTFACTDSVKSVMCNSETEYCALFMGSAGPSAQCEKIPAQCESDVTCACLQASGDDAESCADDAGVVTIMVAAP